METRAGVQQARVVECDMNILSYFFLSIIVIVPKNIYIFAL
jgi:hypothetical protein